MVFKTICVGSIPAIFVLILKLPLKTSKKTFKIQPKKNFKIKKNTLNHKQLNLNQNFMTKTLLSKNSSKRKLNIKQFSLKLKTNHRQKIKIFKSTALFNKLFLRKSNFFIPKLKIFNPLENYKFPKKSYILKNKLIKNLSFTKF